MDFTIELDPTSASSPSTRSGHPPGTPKPPIDPPRRRSSLHFSKVFSCSPPRTAQSMDRQSQDAPVSPRKMDLDTRTTTPSNAGRRRVPLPMNADVTPGHVAQMQKLFQSAKASLRVDMAFAASPDGSIGSRLPPIQRSPEIERPIDTPTPSGAIQTWRYSTAPDILLGLDRDVREPVPDASPVLPEMQNVGTETSFAAEPVSSGFNSPAGAHPSEQPSTDVDYGSSPPPRDDALQHDRGCPSISDIEGRMTGLRVAVADAEQHKANMDESPLVARDSRLFAAGIPLPASRAMSTEIEDTMLTDLDIIEATSDDEIFLSEPAKAAAESAKVKRSVLRSLFFHRSTGKESVGDQQGSPDTPDPADTPSARVETPCPDPRLHELFSRRTYPDPAAHLDRLPAEGDASTTPGASMGIVHASAGDASQPTAMHGYSTRVAPYQRTTATGSPMPFAKSKSPPPSPPLPFARQQPFQQSDTPFSPSPPHKALQRSDYPEQKSEHFQPGWYYTRQASGPSSRLNPMTYSFSTAAAKSVGQSAAPDSRIRDSYRTDTLTPLTKPPSRYRKTSITAMASTRGVGKYYGDAVARAGQATHTGTKKSRRRSGVQFRSSPPFQPADMAPGFNKRRRPREPEDDIVVREDHSQVMELDDDTRAAIRMSLFGTETPEVLHARETLRELSPNVTTTRKDRRQRKKRRPSYWDGDLKEVQVSPAARDENGKVQISTIRGNVREGAERRVLTSPPKEGVESLKSQRIEIEGKENASVRNSMPEGSFSYEVGDDEDVSMTEDGDGTMLAIEQSME